MASNAENVSIWWRHHELFSRESIRSHPKMTIKTSITGKLLHKEKARFWQTLQEKKIVTTGKRKNTNSNKGNLRDLIDLCDPPSNLKSSAIWLMWTKNMTKEIEKQLEISSMLLEVWVSFHSHPWIYIVVTVRKRSDQSQIGNFSACVNLKLTNDI